MGKKPASNYVPFHEISAYLLPGLVAKNIEQPEYIVDLLCKVLSERCTGKFFYVPKGSIKSKQMLSERNDNIKALYDSGVPTADIAHRYHLRESYVLALIKYH